MAQQKLALYPVVKPLARPQLKTISKVVILAEALDVLTTFTGITFFPQMWETNPLPGFIGGWLPTVFAKILATFLVVLVLERVEKWPRLVWLVPIIAGLPVFWNSLCILAELMIT